MKAQDLYLQTLSTVLDQKQDCGHVIMVQDAPTSTTIMGVLIMMM